MATKNSVNKTVIDFIIGLPPITTVTENPTHSTQSRAALLDTMPQAIIYPGIPNFEAGIDLFKRVDAFRGGSAAASDSNQLYYLPMLEAHNYTLDESVHTRGLKVAYIADNFPTDTFTNEYGENFLQKFTDIASEGAASISQMFGARDVREVGKALAARAAAQGGTIGSVGEMAQKAGGYIADLGNTLFGATGGRMANMIGALAAGSRIDFPMVWKTSAFQPSYTMTVRLYNPNPASEQATRKYIIGPIAALMLLGIPISSDSSTYSWPFLHRVVSPGIYDLDPAYIQNITIVKGGDQQQISYRQRLSIVDVRIDFGSLFSSMLASKDTSSKTRPTLRKYLASMEAERPAYALTSTARTQADSRALNSELSASSRNLQGPTQSTSVLDSEPPTSPSDRVAQKIKNVADELVALIPDGFRISTD
jgi:hypothetical protein